LVVVVLWTVFVLRVISVALRSRSDFLSRLFLPSFFHSDNVAYLSVRFINMAVYP